MPLLESNPRKASPEPGSESRDGLIVAILLAVVFHLLLYVATPAEPFGHETASLPENRTLELILEPPEVVELPEETYVRATPNVAEEVPEETPNISDRDQVAAQEETLPGDTQTPFVEGDEEESNRLVQGNPFQQPTPPAPPEASQQDGASPMPAQEAAPQEVEAAPQIAQPESLPAEEVDGPEAIEVVEAQTEPQPEQPPRETEMTSPEDGRGEFAQTTPAQTAAAEGPTPRPRQRVERDTSFGPIKDNRQGTVRVGRLAFDSRYSEFGEYWRRVAEIIELRWRNLVYNTKSIPFNRNKVVVEFFITSDGSVEEVTVSFSSAGRLAETVSMDAIEGEAPFFEWTPDMILTMGERAPCAIHFYY
jgi:outer membrane biosynthesis protein TonB